MVRNLIISSYTARVIKHGQVPISSTYTVRMNMHASYEESNCQVHVINTYTVHINRHTSKVEMYLLGVYYQCVYCTVRKNRHTFNEETY